MKRCSVRMRSTLFGRRLNSILFVPTRMRSLGTIWMDIITTRGAPGNTTPWPNGFEPNRLLDYVRSLPRPSEDERRRNPQLQNRQTLNRLRKQRPDGFDAEKPLRRRTDCEAARRARTGIG